MTKFEDRYRLIPAVFVIFRDGDKVLLLRRAGTGYRDGQYSMPSGHVDGSEPAAQAAAREAKEEVGVSIDLDALRLVHTMHQVSEEPELHERMNLFFETTVWHGQLTNAEPNKCDELKWALVANLPENTVTAVTYALKQIAAGEPYSEFGFETEQR